MSKKKKISNTVKQLNKSNSILLYYHDFKNVTLKKNSFSHIYEFYQNNNNVFNHLSMMPNNIASNVKQSLIIFESSVIGKYVMFPWVENDPDIKNNLYLKHVLHYYQKKKSFEKGIQYHSLGNQITYYNSLNRENKEEIYEDDKSLNQEKNDIVLCSVYNNTLLSVEPTHASKTNKRIDDSRNETKHKKKKRKTKDKNNSFIKKKSRSLKKRAILNLSLDKTSINCNASSSINSYRRYSSSISGVSLGFTWNKLRHRKNDLKGRNHTRELKMSHVKKETKEINKLKNKTDSIEKKREKEKRKKKKEKKKEQLQRSAVMKGDERKRSRHRKNAVNKSENTSEFNKKNKTFVDSDDIHDIVEQKKEKKNGGKLTSLMKKPQTKCGSTVDLKYFKNSTKRGHNGSARKRKNLMNRNSKIEAIIAKKKLSLIKPLYLLEEDMTEQYNSENMLQNSKKLKMKICSSSSSSSRKDKMYTKKNKNKEKVRKPKEKRQNEVTGNKKERESCEENNTYNSLLFAYDTHVHREKKNCENEKRKKTERRQIIERSEQHKMPYNNSHEQNNIQQKKANNLSQDRILGNLKKKIDKTEDDGDNDKNKGDSNLEHTKGNEILSTEECNHKYKLSGSCLKRNFVYCEKCTKTRCVYHYLNNYKLYGWLNYKWTDPDGFLELSKRQQRKFFAWKRLSDLYNNPVVMTSNLCSNCIRQGFVADCSFLSALTVLIEYERKHKSNVLSNIISPYTSNYLHLNKSWPIYNPSGMYICRLHCNGVQRKIIIDDFVPVKSNDSLLVAYSNNQQELWVTLLEKAFVKLMGGSYSMFGSNPGSDLYYLTGWIPITISFKSKVSSSPPSMEISAVHTRDTNCFERIQNKNHQSLALKSKKRVITQNPKKKNHLYRINNRNVFLNHSTHKTSYFQNSIMYKKVEPNLNFHRILRNVNWASMNCDACKKYKKWKFWWIYTRMLRKNLKKKNAHTQKPTNKKRRDWEFPIITKKLFLCDPTNNMDYTSYAYNSKPGSKYGSIGKNSNTSVISNKNENSVMTDETENTYDKKWDIIWNNIYDGIKKGKCVVCLGTLELDDAAPSGLDFPEGVSISTGIVTRHAYSILNIETYKGDKLLYVKNPWGCIRWKGKYSHQDEQTWTKELQKKLNYSVDKAKNKDDGCFWIQWKEVVKYFSHIYICWNSSIFPYHVEIHTKWENNILLKSSILSDDTHLVAYNPQFALNINVRKQDLSEDGSFYIGKKPIEVWILLSRHVKERKTDVSQKYLALHVHAGKNRITCPLFPIKQGVYSNGECTFTKLVIGGLEEDNFDYGLENRDYNIPSEELFENFQQSKNQGNDNSCKEKLKELAKRNSENLSQTNEMDCLRNVNFVLIVSQYSQKEEFNFTLKAFSHTSVSLYELPPLLSDKFESTYFKGKWTSKCAGGCSNNLWSYFKNPHIRLFVPEESTFTIFLECAQEHSVNLRIFKGMTSSPRTLKKGEVISSGPYRAGCCFIECTLESGIYSLIPSLYRANTTGNYQICIHHSKLKKKPILYFIPYPFVIPPFSFFKYHVSHLYSSNNYSLIFFHITSVTLVSVRVIFFQNFHMKGIPLVNIYKMVMEDNNEGTTMKNDCTRNDVESGRLVHNNVFKSKINYKGYIYELVEKCNIHGSSNNNILPFSSCAYDYYVKFNSVFIPLVELENTKTYYMLLITTNLKEDVLSNHEAHFISDKPTLVDSFYPHV